MPENNLKSPEKHRKSGTSSWKAPPRCYKDNTFSGGKQIVLKSGMATKMKKQGGFSVSFNERIFYEINGVIGVSLGKSLGAV